MCSERGRWDLVTHRYPHRRVCTDFQHLGNRVDANAVPWTQRMLLEDQVWGSGRHFFLRVIYFLREGVSGRKGEKH